MGLRTQGKNVIPFPAFLLPSLPLLNDWLHFNLEAGNRFRKFILMLQPGPSFSRDRVSPLDTPGPLLGMGWSEARCSRGHSRGGRGGARGLGAVPTLGSLGCRPRGAALLDTRTDTWRGGDSRCFGPAWRGAQRPTPSHLTDPASPFESPLRSLVPQSAVFWGRGAGDPSVPLAQRAGSPQPPFPPGMHRPPPLPRALLPPHRPSPPAPPSAPLPAHPSRPSGPLPRRPRAAGPSARCRRPRRRRESPGRTRSPRCAEGGRAASGAAGAAARRPGLGFLLGQTPPQPADPTPCAFLPGGARSGTRSEVGGRRGERAVSRVGEGSAEAALVGQRAAGSLAAAPGSPE